MMTQKIKNLFYKFKYACQRFKRGYDDSDVISIDIAFRDKYLKILKDYREHFSGYPTYLNNEDEWLKIINELIQCLEMTDEETVMLHMYEGMPADFEPNYEDVYDVMKRNKDRFFELFSKHFFELWL